MPLQKAAKKNPLLLIGLGLLLLAFIVDYGALPAYHKYKINNKPQQIQSIIHKKENKVEAFFDTIKVLNQQKIFDNFKGLAESAHENGFKLFIYQNRQLIFWNNNKVLPQTKHLKAGTLSLKNLGNGYYLQKSVYKGQYLFVTLLPVKTNYSIQNEYLQNQIKIGNNLGDYFTININSKKGKSIYSSSGEHLFSLKRKETTASFEWPFWIYALGLLILFLGLTRSLNILLFNGQPYRAITLFTIVSILIGLDIAFWQFPRNFFAYSLFETSTFSATPFIQSMGSFFIALVLLSAVIHYLHKYFKIFLSPTNPNRQLPFSLLLYLLTIVLSHSAFSLMGLLILESDINWDVKNFYDLSTLSVAGVASLFLIFYNLVVLTSWLFNQVKETILKRPFKFFGIAAIIAIVYQVLAFTSFIPNYIAGLFAIGIWCGLSIGYPRTAYNYGMLTFFMLWSSAFTAIHLIDFNQEKEIKHQKHLATQATYQRDVVAEHLFQNVSREIRNDKYIQNFFFNPVLPKSYLEKRIRELYFSRYLNKYDLKIHTFKYGGAPYKERSSQSLGHFQKLINKYGLKTPGKNLNFINKTGSNPTYLALYQFNWMGKMESTLVIELKKKVFYEESIYPELLLEEGIVNRNVLEGYSHAIYKNNRLISQNGDYPYPVQTDIKHAGNVFYQFRENGYNHLFHQVSHNTFVIVSKEPAGILHQISVFSILLIAFFILAIGLVGIQKWNFHQIRSMLQPYRQLKHGRFPIFTNLFFQEKIQFTILLLVLLVMTTVGISTVNYLKYDYNQQLNDDLNNKIKQILPVLENEIQAQGPKFYNDKEKLYVTVKNLSNRFQSDINIFDLNGFLITSSQPRVYRKNIQANLMDNLAYRKMRLDKRSQLIQSETIGDLDYLAAYAPIRNAQNQIIGFLNLPYFSKESELKNEISSLIITLVDLYVLIFLIVILVSLSISKTLTKPLDLIREKLQKTQLGQSNEPIEWESKDELGRLIKEYNEMIKALEENAEALAKSEREGAWREMARQVAHEIKNPLTPMKLNIQRLQSQFKDTNDPRNQDVQKVSRILIQQIDHLSKIATDFSSFARISLGEPVKVLVEEELLNQKTFFEINQTNTTIQTDFQTADSKIWMDQNHFSRITTNLLKNALEASLEDTENQITIGTEYRGKDQILIWIADRGSGIPEEKQEKIFQPNFSTKNSGTGLGLAMVKKMVESASGKIWFDSKPEKGTTFYIQFALMES